ncbi:hypothetical protein Tco_1513686, partial [Tanacetum coccineum]
TSRTGKLRCKSWNSSSRVGSGFSGCGGLVSTLGCCRLVWGMAAFLKCVLMALIELEGQLVGYSVGDGLQHSVNFVGYLALLLFEIGFRLG